MVGTLTLFAACSSDDSTFGDSATGSQGVGGDDGAGVGGAGGGTAGTGGDMIPEVPMRQFLSGDITWTVTFDEAAKETGATDCSYTRHYEGDQDASAPWLCPNCDVVFYLDVTMPDGLEDCFHQISGDQPPNPNEWIGYESATNTWYRGFGTTMGAQGEVTVDGAELMVVNQIDEVEFAPGGTLGFAVAGALTESTVEGDPMHGYVAPDTYACGWPKADPEPYQGDYQLVEGGTIPDFLLVDQCEETVRLHDFKGTYLVVDMSALDCPPCQQFAAGEEAFVEEMAAEGIEVHVITAMAPSLSNVLGETSQAQLAKWISDYGLASPVLVDRGWGLTEFATFFEDAGSYPSWVLVDPELNAVELGQGFGGWPAIKASIVADAAR